MAAERLRDHGLRIGELEAGPRNSSTDVEGVTVGHVTVRRDEPDPPGGRGVARTGVTAIVPGGLDGLVRTPIRAGTAVLNGAGELTGSIQIAEWGCIETPVYLTSTMAVGRIYDGAVAAAVASDPSVGSENFVIPVVGECDDGWLNDARTVQVETQDVSRALGRAGKEVEEGAVVALSTARAPEAQDFDRNAFFAAAVDATEESVFNSLWAAEDVVGRAGRIIRALPREPVLELLRRERRI